ncbi:MAG: hypothetical protein JWM91_5124 [Rhodospirillales bacterium]|nr:hypothetical protein [Rhodospirillales bacterium]
MPEATIVALYDRYENASAAVGDIIDTGASRDKISLLANNLSGDHPPLVTNPAYAREEVDTKENTQPGIVTGAEFGIGVGGILGLMVGTGAIVIPGIGPLIAAGTWAAVAAGAAAGGVVGGAIGLLTTHGISDNDAHLYAEGLKRGGTLVAIVAEESQIDVISHIFKTHGAVDIEKRGATWSAEGWVSFDPYQSHLSSAELAAIRSDTPDHGVEHHHAVRHYFHPSGDTAEVPGGASNSANAYGDDELKN